MDGFLTYYVSAFGKFLVDTCDVNYFLKISSYTSSNRCNLCILKSLFDLTIMGYTIKTVDPFDCYCLPVTVLAHENGNATDCKTVTVVNR